MNDEFVDYILQLIVNTSGLGGCSALSAWKTSSPSLASEPRAAQGPPRAFYARSCGAVLAFGKLGTKNQQLSWRRFRKLNGCNEAGHSFALLGLDSCSISARDCPLDCILSLVSASRLEASLAQPSPGLHDDKPSPTNGERQQYPPLPGRERNNPRPPKRQSRSAFQ